MPTDSQDNANRTFERGVAQSGVRLANERAVLALIALNPGVSNADLARMSGLGPQTTSRIVAELDKRNLLIRGEVLRGRRGQPATPLFLDPQSAFCFGVEIGWRHFEVLLIEMSGKVLTKVRKSYDYPDARTVFDAIAEEISRIYQQLSPMQQERLVGAGVASPSSIDWNILKIGAPQEQVELWKDIDVGAALAEKTGMTVQWLNDGDAACWSELIAHPQPRPKAFAYFQIGVFIGAGIVVNREIWTGLNGDAANLGAMMVSSSKGEPTYLFKIGSILALEARLQEAGLAIPGPSPLDWDWAALEPVAGEWVDETGLALAQAVLTVRAFVDVGLVAFDGQLPRDVMDRVFQRIEHYLALMPRCSLNLPLIGKGTMGASAAATGVAQRMLFDQFFSRAWTLFSA